MTVMMCRQSGVGVAEPLAFQIAFHGPFHVGGLGAVGGMDRVLDRDFLLPGSSLKGLLRAEARERLGIPKPWLEATFGREGDHPSPWWWSDGVVDSPTFGRAVRIKINPDTSASERGFLALGEEVWARTGHFTVAPMINLPEERLPTAEQRLLIRACARSVSTLGGGRNRGSGWVTLTDGEPWTITESTAFLAMRESAVQRQDLALGDPFEKVRND